MKEYLKNAFIFQNSVTPLANTFLSYWDASWLSEVIGGGKKRLVQ